jgi:hypothetical protein
MPLIAADALTMASFNTAPMAPDTKACRSEGHFFPRWDSLWSNHLLSASKADT